MCYVIVVRREAELEPNDLSVIFRSNLNWFDTHLTADVTDPGKKKQKQLTF